MTETKPTPRIAVLGVGNTYMGDDAVGAAVLERLSRRELPDNVDLIADETAGMHLVRHFRQCDLVYFVDAVAVDADPGAVFRFTPEEAGIDKLRSNNIHGMGLSYLVANARLVGADPDVIVYGVQYGDVMPNGGKLTAEVERAADFVADSIVEELRERVSGAASEPD